ncbi:MAG: hypothetical protein HLX50_11600 [Alteromonadaceae bacterium]|nr:hypothetical protein [Alteromonadaceae bacterium]
MSLLKSHQWGNTFGAAAVFSLMLGLSGCGSSGGSGSSDDTGDSGSDNTGSINEQAATIQTEEDTEQGAVATVESAQQAILDDNASGILPTGVAIKEDGHHQWLIDHSIAMAEQATMPTGAVYTIDGNCGGSATVNRGFK